MGNDVECGQSPQEHDLAQRTLRALAVAQLRRAQYELAKSHLLSAMERSEQLQAEDIVWERRLRETITSLAQEQLASGRSPVETVILLHEIVDEAALDRRIRKEVEPEVVLWGIEGYFAA
jgi:hypothetical protein